MNTLPQQSVRVELGVEPARVVVGDTVELTVLLHHAPGAELSLSADAFDYSWVVLDRAGSLTRPSADGGGAVTTHRWTITSLEAGTRELPVPSVHDASGTAVAVAVGPLPTLEVGAVLGTNEDAPRPIVGFQEPEAADTGFPWGWAALPLLLVVALAAWVAHRRRDRLADAAPRATPDQRLAALEARDLDEPEHAELGADVHRELTQLVREHFDLRAGATRVSSTDEEWLELAAGELTEQQRTRLTDLFIESRAVKYGGACPTHWALQESVAAARAVLADASRLEEVAS